jgi:hypothetical protein
MAFMSAARLQAARAKEKANSSLRSEQQTRDGECLELGA